jgi:hypothetical protein
MRRMWLAIVPLSLGCADEIPEDVSAEMEAARSANESAADTLSGPTPAELLVTAPAGGHADWIRDIRTGLDTVPAEAGLDRGEALHIVQELYSRRFEPLRQFYGPGGAADAGPQLAQAVERVGMQLQALMGHLAGNEADAALIKDAVGASQDALDRAEAAAQAAGLSPTAPRDIITTDS